MAGAMSTSVDTQSGKAAADHGGQQAGAGAEVEHPRPGGGAHSATSSQHRAIECVEAGDQPAPRRVVVAGDGIERGGDGRGCSRLMPLPGQAAAGVAAPVPRPTHKRRQPSRGKAFMRIDGRHQRTIWVAEDGRTVRDHRPDAAAARAARGRPARSRGGGRGDRDHAGARRAADRRHGRLRHVPGAARRSRRTRGWSRPTRA